MRASTYSLLTTGLLLASPASFAYLNPGAGLTLLGTLLSVGGVLLLATLSVLFYPLQQLYYRLKKRDPEHAEGSDELADSTAPGADQEH